MGIVDTNILLETGTNELEILEFVISGNSYGINVAKITELMQIQEVQEMPLSHPCVEGVFQPRDEVYTIVDLSRYLGLGPSDLPDKDIFIITNFNQMNIAFHVHAVESIFRISWNDIEKPDSIIYGGQEGVVTGIAKVNDRIISILDFEKITFDISPETGIDLSTVAAYTGEDRERIPIVVAEDSALLRKMLTEALQTSGYNNLLILNNGEEAWEYITSIKASGTTDVLSKVACLITDIEMPRMDGHRLTRLIKNDAVLMNIPVVIFSSLIDENMQKKGFEVGADAQLSKPEIARLVDVVDEMIQRSRMMAT
ncbi:MAG: chemotaxis protein [Oscillospiraceae bacterium]|jgi:two-component system chemotaxis response regulator CheV|nr:chemotaxis protein [Oscillospiraceae bacterium]